MPAFLVLFLVLDLVFEVAGAHEVALKRDPTDCRPRLRIGRRVGADELNTEN